jgi:hypothetical protein
MGDNQAILRKGKDTITPGGYRFVMLWAASLLFLYALGVYFGTGLLRGYAAETVKLRETRMALLFTEQNAPASARTPSGTSPVDVQMGLIMNHVGEFSMREAAWTADFNLFFRWTGDGVNPGESFRLANGQILQREKVESSRRGMEHSAEYHVVARMTKPFDASRFPFSDEGLLVRVEDATHEVRYVADNSGSKIGPDALPRGVKLGGIMVESRAGRVDPAPVGGKTEARSELVFGLLIVPDSFGIYLQMFQALFASVAIALIVLFIRPIHVDPRFGLPVGGFFAAVGNNVYLSSLLPHSDRFTLANLVNATGLFTIFLVLVQSAISLYLQDTLGQERLRRLFDHVSFAVFLVGYVAINLAFPFAAKT